MLALSKYISPKDLPRLDRSVYDMEIRHRIDI